MPIPCDIRELEHANFVECPTGSGLPAKRVKVCSSSADPVFVEVVAEGSGDQIINAFGEVSSVPVSASVDVVSYTVPVGKLLKLKLVEVSGDNRSELSIFEGATKLAFKRLDDNNWNETFEFYNYTLAAGTVIKLTAINCSDDVAKFEGRILGGLIDE